MPRDLTFHSNNINEITQNLSENTIFMILNHTDETWKYGLPGIMDYFSDPGRKYTICVLNCRNNRKHTDSFLVPRCPSFGVSPLLIFSLMIFLCPFRSTTPLVLTRSELKNQKRLEFKMKYVTDMKNIFRIDGYGKINMNI